MELKNRHLTWRWCGRAASRRALLSALLRRAVHLHVKQQQMAGTMAYDEKKIEMAVLALLYYGSFERPGNRSAWKTYDWAITERLFEQGLIGDPRGTSKSIVFTPEGEVRAKAAFEALFSAGSSPGGGRPAKAKKGKRARSD